MYRLVVNKNLSLVTNKHKELPNNIQAEQAVIGSILTDNEIFDDVNTIISEKNFFDPMHQKIFSSMQILIYKGMLANPITLKNYFEIDNDDLNIPEYLIKITKFATSSRQSIEYSKIIYDMYVRRELIKISENIIDNAKINDLNKSCMSVPNHHDECSLNPNFEVNFFKDFSVNKWVCPPPRCLLKTLGNIFSTVQIKENIGTKIYIYFIFLFLFINFIISDMSTKCSRTPIRDTQLKSVV